MSEHDELTEAAVFGAAFATLRVQGGPATARAGAEEAVRAWRKRHAEEAMNDDGDTFSLGSWARVREGAGAPVEGWVVGVVRKRQVRQHVDPREEGTVLPEPVPTPWEVWVTIKTEGGELLEYPSWVLEPGRS